MATSGLHTFLTHYVSNRFGEHPFAIMIQVALMYRLCYSLLLALKGTRLVLTEGFEPSPAEPQSTMLPLHYDGEIKYEGLKSLSRRYRPVTL